MKPNCASAKTFVLIATFLMGSFGWFTDSTDAYQDKKEAPKKPKKIDFDKHIKPIFAKYCISCHGPKQAKSKFRVDRRESFIKGGDYGEPMIVPGKSSKSRLIPIIEKTDDDLLMPPSWGSVPPAGVALIKQWIDEGAKMPKPEKDSKESDRAAVLKSDHWSLQPVQRPKLPVNDSKWPANSIDRWVLQKLQEKSLSPSRRAPRHVLIRRLYLVMLGMPPTPKEVDDFINDRDPNAWKTLVDRVLADPRYGERWAQHWLDIVRFGESDGFETNRERPNAWRYRDWVIQSLNQDKPYDQFIKEQIAGDVLGAPVGTGFLVAGPYDIVKSPDINLTLMQRQDELADFVHTTGTAFLGLTIGCARCHDHKFDPISQTDFYALQAVFAGVQHGEREIPPQVNKSDLAELNGQINKLNEKLRPYLASRPERFVFLDNTIAASETHGGIDELERSQGQGVYPTGTEPGFRDDPGSENRPANLSGGSYSWWTNQPGTNFIAYRPRIRGKYRVWISWGSGYSTHSKNAEYWLDQDSSQQSTNDQKLIAKVNQQQPANPQAQFSKLPEAPRWSGFLDAGVHQFGSGSSILLRGGKSGAAVTADMIVFEKVESDQPDSGLGKIRLPINSRFNQETFAPVKTLAIRFSLIRTNQAEPCIDEWQVISGDKNLAVDPKVTKKISSSGNFAGNPKHQLKHVNDGKFGNPKSWIANTAGNAWLQIEFHQPQRVDRMTWSRDRLGKFNDRTVSEYRFEFKNAKGDWEPLVDSRDRLPLDFSQPKPDRYENKDQSVMAQIRNWQSELAKRLKTRQAHLQPAKAYVGTFNPNPAVIHRLHRGDPMSKREAVPPNTVRIIGDLALSSKAAEAQRRLKFAEWVANKKNPLTARVIVNRIWQYHFGTGMVSTASDFGANGTPPTHPQLLDELAAMIVKNNWSIKSIHRAILMSNTWQQDSRPQTRGLKQDAAARLLWRFPIRRLEAESIRDSMVSVSGVLDRKMGGPGFSAFEVQLENVRHYFPKKEYGPADWRRMIYMTKIRQEKESTFGAFDCPDGSQVIPNRSRSTTPLQALNLFNSQFVAQQAKLLATRLEKETAEAERNGVQPVFAQIRLAYRLCYSRNPSARELAIAREFISEHDLEQFCRAMLNSNEFLFIS